MRAVVAHGIAQQAWRRLWVPTYLCQEVVGVLSDTGIPLEPYPDAPNEATQVPEEAEPSDAFLIVNTFGLDRRFAPLADGVVVIEDHTHDPWSPWAQSSSADWCVASLRKTLPISDGAVLWSPKGHQKPDPVPLSPARFTAAANKLAAMWLKRLCVHGHAIDKAVFRELATAGEEAIASGEVSGISPWSRETVRAFGVGAWRQSRRRNFETLTRALSDVPWLNILEPASDDACPFSTVVVVDTPARRDRLRQHLIDNRIYPATLWPLEETVLPIPWAHRDLSRRTLSLHCDGRYDASDLARVAEEVIEGGA
jgi:hypothetical protein